MERAFALPGHRDGDEPNYFCEEIIGAGQIIKEINSVEDKVELRKDTTVCGLGRCF